MDRSKDIWYQGAMAQCLMRSESEEDKRFAYLELSHLFHIRETDRLKRELKREQQWIVNILTLQSIGLFFAAVGHFITRQR